MLSSVRRKEAIKLRESGLTYAAIGEKWGISRQRAWQVLNAGPGSDRAITDEAAVATFKDKQARKRKRELM